MIVFIHLPHFLCPLFVPRLIFRLPRFCPFFIPFIRQHTSLFPALRLSSRFSIGSPDFFSTPLTILFVSLLRAMPYNMLSTTLHMVCGTVFSFSFSDFLYLRCRWQLHGPFPGIRQYTVSLLIPT